MNSVLEIAVVLSAVDRMSQVFATAIGSSQAKLKEFSESYKRDFATGTSLIAAGTTLAASLSPAIDAYAELEDSSMRLQTVMTADGGVISEHFEAVNKIATDLGGKLPGTTADFQNMMATLQKSGVSSESIIGGVGKAAAYLAVGLNIPFNEAAKMSAKLKESTGTADADMLGFMDTIARVNQVGVETGEMSFAFSRSAGTLKLLNLQGAEAAKSVSAVYAQLIKAGASGETVGTGMTSIFSAFMNDDKMKAFNEEAGKLGLSFEFVDQKTGQFKGIENMIEQFDQLQQFNPKQRANLVQTLLGPGQDASFMNTLISQGIAGYNDMQKKMASQTTLNAKVDGQLGTYKNMKEAAEGAVTNALATFGKSFSNELKVITNLLGSLAGKADAFAAAHPKLAKFIGLFIAVSSALAILVGVVFVAKAAFAAFNVVLLANPFVLIAVAIVAIGLAIYVFWDEIVAFFKSMWAYLKSIFMAAWEWIKYLPIIYVVAIIVHNWNRIVNFFTTVVWAKIKQAFFAVWSWLKYIPLFYVIDYIITNWGKIVGFFGNLWDRVKAVFVSKMQYFASIGKMFFTAGMTIVNMLWNGIKSIAEKPVQAIKNIVQKMRDYLPYSPAKEGPFRDLHKVKIVETIAQAMKPAAAVEAVGRVTKAARTAFNAKAPGGAPGRAGGGSGGGSVVINYSPNITISGSATPEAVQTFEQLLRKHAGEINRIVEEQLRRKQRLAY